MKRKPALLVLIIACVFSLQGLAVAGDEDLDIYEGTVKTVESGTRKIELSTSSGRMWVSYDENTKWPEGVVDPSILAGEDVKVTTEFGRAVKVEED